MFGQRQFSQSSFGSRVISQQIEYPQYNRHSNNEHMELYSTSNDSRSIIDSQFSQHRRNISEEICNMLSSSLENSIPRISEQCLNLVLSKIDTDYEKQNNQLIKLKQDLIHLKDSLKSSSESEKEIYNTYQSNVLNKIEDFKSDVEKNLSLKNELKEISSKDIIKVKKVKDSIFKLLVDLKKRAKDKSSYVQSISSLLNDQIIVDEVCAYLDQKVNTLTSSVEINKNFIKTPLGIEDLSKKMDIINDNVNQLNNVKKSTGLVVTPTVTLSIENSRGISAIPEMSRELVMVNRKEDLMMLDIVNNFEKMKNVKPKKKKKNKVMNPTFYRQFYY